MVRIIQWLGIKLLNNLFVSICAYETYLFTQRNSTLIETITQLVGTQNLTKTVTEWHPHTNKTTQTLRKYLELLSMSTNRFRIKSESVLTFNYGEKLARNGFDYRYQGVDSKNQLSWWSINRLLEITLVL